MKAIVKREFRAYFQTVTGWLYIAAGMALYGLYFYAINMSYGEPKIASSLGSALFLSLITVPVLTMRSLSEEKRSRTDQLLFTSPVSVGKVVLAKYLACALVHTISMLPVCAAPLVMTSFGSAPLGENYVAVLGFWLYGLTCIAIGIFASALTESQLISAVLTFAFLFIGYMMGGISSLISSGGNLLTKILGGYDLVAPIDKFFEGNLSVSGIVYYLSLTALFLFLGTQAIQKRRWDADIRKIRTGVFSTGFIAAGTAVTIAVNLVAVSLPVSITEIDLTSGKIFSLTDETKDLLAGLEDDVTIYVISSEAGADATVASTLGNYSERSKRVHVEYRDPAVSPTFYQQYTDGQISQGSLIVVCGDVSRVVDYNSLYVSETDYATYQQTVTGYDAEGQITSAIQYVTSGDLPKVYELTGHGEAALAGGFAEAVAKANMTTESISLLNSDAVPNDAYALIINGPTSDLSGDDADKVRAWMETGGNVIATYNYEAPDELPNFGSLPGGFGVGVASGIVVEADPSGYYQQQLYLLPQITPGEYTASLGESYVFAPYAKGFTRGEDAEGVTYSAMLSSSDSSYAKANIQQAETLEYGDGDTKGPFDIGAVAEKSGGDGNALSRLVLLGSSLILSDEADQVVSGANAALFSDILSALGGEDAAGAVVVPAKEYDVSTLVVSAASALAVGICYIAVFPVALLALGIFVWMRRRRA
jgi:ABC-2 type transport system permease protein